MTKELLVGSVKSKTQWMGVLAIIVGVLIDNPDLTGQLIPPQYAGKLLAAFGLISMILRLVTTEALADKAAPKEGGFIRLEFAALLAALCLFAPGCANLASFMQPLPRAESSEPAPVKAARAAIDEANAALIGLNTVIGDNAQAGVWTKTQAQAYLDDSKAAGKRLDRAREALRAGLPLDAQSQAEAVRTLILALHKRAAAEARKEK